MRSSARSNSNRVLPRLAAVLLIVIFPQSMPTSSAEGTVAFQLTAHTPLANAVDVPRDSAVTAAFSANLDTSTVTTGTFTVRSTMTALYTGAFSFPAEDELRFAPDQPFKPGETLFVAGSSQVLGSGGEVLDPHTWQFTAAAAPAEAIFIAHPLAPTFGEGYSTDVVLGDLDGDGDLDAVVADDGQAQTVWMNDGSGVFTSHPGPPAFGAGISYGLALGDLDADGDLDAVVANYGGPQTVWLNDGSGAFAAHPIAPTFGTEYGWGLALGDLDGDGDLDAVIATQDSQPQTVWLNDGSGAFTPHPGVPSFGGGATWDVALGDLDGDGDLDAMVTDDNLQAERVWLNDGGGAFAVHPLAPFGFGSGESWDVDLADLDADGDLDAVVANFSTTPETVWLNNGGGLFSAHPQAPSFGAGNSTRLDLGDLDGDGDMDAAVANDLGEAETVWLNDGTGAFTAHPDRPNFGGRSSAGVALGDLDGDGDLDALVANYYDEAQEVWLNEVHRSYLPLVVR